MKKMFKRSKKTKKDKIKVYSNEGFFIKLLKFMWLKIYDVYKILRYGKEFDQYGMTLYVGDQGSGKSMALTEELERLRVMYPKALIVSNYGYIHESKEFTDWNDFFDIRNGVDGVIFAIDEIQNEFHSKAWKNFPEELLGEITQQRKQRVKILATAQVWEDVVVQLRRQTLFVAECSTVSQRWTKVRCYKRRDYERLNSTVSGREKVFKVYSRSFIQNDYLRGLYDTEKKIERLSRTRFQSKSERGVING